MSTKQDKKQIIMRELVRQRVKHSSFGRIYLSNAYFLFKINYFLKIIVVQFIYPDRTGRAKGQKLY